MALAFLGRVIFGILRQVAMRTCFLDRIDDQGTLGAQDLEFRRELFVARLL